MVDEYTDAGLAVQVGRGDTAEHVENFWKSAKPHKSGRQWRCRLFGHVKA